MNRGGVLVYSRRYPKYSRLTLPWILSSMMLSARHARALTLRARLRGDGAESTILPAGGTESMMLSARVESIILSAPPALSMR
jgi:hypothetical protein